MFGLCISFNSDVSAWDMANATHLMGMFEFAALSILTFQLGT
jgi:surface protein